ncbi:hypothetical protein KA005_48010 [bacterium]|nr:hypothetical protein [bacterium]
MKKLLIMLAVLVVFAGLVWSAGEVAYTRGNVEAIRYDFTRFYIDSVSVKATVSTTITVPDGYDGYNLKITLPDPSGQEESLKTWINVNTMWGVINPNDTIRKYLIVTDFGYDQKADTFKYYGGFNAFTLGPSTNTAGASAAESVMTFIFEFSVK